MKFIPLSSRNVFRRPVILTGEDVADVGVVVVAAGERVPAAENDSGRRRCGRKSAMRTRLPLPMSVGQAVVEDDDVLGEQIVCR